MCGCPNAFHSFVTVYLCKNSQTEIPVLLELRRVRSSHAYVATVALIRPDALVLSLSSHPNTWLVSTTSSDLRLTRAFYITHRGHFTYWKTRIFDLKSSRGEKGHRCPEVEIRRLRVWSHALDCVVVWEWHDSGDDQRNHSCTLRHLQRPSEKWHLKPGLFPGRTLTRTNTRAGRAVGKRSLCVVRKDKWRRHVEQLITTHYRHLVTLLTCLYNA